MEKQRKINWPSRFRKDYPTALKLRALVDGMLSFWTFPEMKRKVDFVGVARNYTFGPRLQRVDLEPLLDMTLREINEMIEFETQWKQQRNQQ